MKRFLPILIIAVSFAPALAQFSRTDNITEYELRLRKKEVEPLYRKPTKKELKAVEPSRALFEKYAEFLRQPNTGLTKLIDDKGCSQNSNVVVATADCLRYTMPGAGSSFSFRTESYRMPRLADITFTDKSFQASGARLHGLFVNLGDVDPEQVTTSTAGMKFLVGFQPESDFEKGRQIDQQLTEGIKSDGFLYRRGLYVVENTTFALRSVAYRGKYFRAIKDLTYNEFDYDKRRDVLVIFRIVEKDPSGNVTILWKRLWEKESPEMIRELPPQKDPA